MHDVVHEIAAVGSRSVQKATEFINEVAGGDKSIKAYGSYEEVYADSNIDAIYIGTPHTHHYVNALDAIKAKKHVLCEKPVTLNAAELHSLLDAAKKNNVFFMEAMWTRFHPLAKALKAIAEEGTLGSPVTLRADLSMDFNIESAFLDSCNPDVQPLSTGSRTAQISQDTRSTVRWRSTAGPVSLCMSTFQYLIYIHHQRSLSTSLGALKIFCLY